MADFIIHEEFDQVTISMEGNIEISGLWVKGAFNIVRDASSAQMRCHMSETSVAEKCGVTIEVDRNSIILAGDELTILPNPDEYPVEAIIININSMRKE